MAKAKPAAGTPVARSRNPRGQGERLRGEIVEAAIRLLASGFEVTPLSLRAVAREIGVAPQSVYLHFPGKSELLYAVVETLFGDLEHRLDQAAAPHEKPRARLRASCLAYCAYGFERPGHYKLLFESRLMRQIGTGYYGSPGQKVFDGLVEAVRVNLDGTAPKDARETAFVLWSGIHGVTSLRWSKPGMPWPSVERMIDRLLEGVVWV